MLKSSSVGSEFLDKTENIVVTATKVRSLHYLNCDQTNECSYAVAEYQKAEIWPS